MSVLLERPSMPLSRQRLVPARHALGRFASATPLVLGLPLGSPRHSRTEHLSPTSATDSMLEHPPSRSTSRAREASRCLRSFSLRIDDHAASWRLCSTRLARAIRPKPHRLGSSKAEALEDDGTTQDHHCWQPCPECEPDGRRAHSFDRSAPSASRCLGCRPRFREAPSPRRSRPRAK